MVPGITPPLPNPPHAGRSRSGETAASHTGGPSRRRLDWAAPRKDPHGGAVDSSCRLARSCSQRCRHRRPAPHGACWMHPIDGTCGPARVRSRHRRRVGRRDMGTGTGTGTRATSTACEPTKRTRWQSRRLTLLPTRWRSCWHCSMLTRRRRRMAPEAMAPTTRGCSLATAPRQVPQGQEARWRIGSATCGHNAPAGVHPATGTSPSGPTTRLYHTTTAQSATTPPASTTSAALQRTTTAMLMRSHQPVQSGTRADLAVCRRRHRWLRRHRCRRSGRRCGH